MKQDQAIPRSTLVDRALNQALGRTHYTESNQLLAGLLVDAAIRLRATRRLTRFGVGAFSFYGLPWRYWRPTWLGLGIEKRPNSQLRVCIKAFVLFGARRGRWTVWIEGNEVIGEHNGEFYYRHQWSTATHEFIAQLLWAVIHPFRRYRPPHPGQ